MRKLIPLLLILCFLLCGCENWLDGHYLNVVPRKEQAAQPSRPTMTVYSYSQLYSALTEQVESGAPEVFLTLNLGNETLAKPYLDSAIEQLCQENPFAVYAVESITYEFGSNGGRNTAAVNISYLRNRVDVKKIQRVEDMTQAKEYIASQLRSCSSGLVLYLENVPQTDFVQLVTDYAETYPQYVIEVPEVTVGLYPESSANQVIELKFSYQTSRESLRAMQSRVHPVFASAALIAQNEATTEEKLSQLYALLMERYEKYELQTSITPAYSLLLHGVGDARAFAAVYAAMCREAGLNCSLIAGTRQGTPWVWNVVQTDNGYYHLDLLKCSAEGLFSLTGNSGMEGYVWDYSAFETVP
jgi:hypothetical protein